MMEIAEADSEFERTKLNDINEAELEWASFEYYLG